MRPLLALLLFLPSLCLAQLPTYVPTDGLIAWYPLNGDANDVSGNDLDLSLSGQVSHEDQSENPDEALLFSGQPIIATQPELNLTGYLSFTLSIWLMKASNDEHYAIMGNSEGAGETNKGLLQFGWVQPNTYSWHVNAPGQPGFGNFSSGFSPAIYEWHHITYVKDSLDYAIYINGLAAGAGSYLYEQNLASSSTYIGNAQDCCNLGFHGAMDNLGLWSRALDATEVMSLFIEALPNAGCTDQEACNFQPDANVDDGSCVTCEVLAAACGEGTVWDSTLQECVTDLTFPTAPCGEGTVWDPVNEECIIAIPADLNYDGCVTVADLLELLAVHGTCPPLPEWPDEPTDNTWACGDPLTYWDYDYATVLIGDQCWFAENLRSENYVNGDAIPAGLSDSEWSSTTSGATAVYGESALNFEAYGRLYNWYAVDDVRGLCPSGWHVSTDEEWMTVEMALGMSEVEANDTGWRGTDQGTQLKASPFDNPSWNGSNSSGFSGLPGGFRHVDGTFYYAGNDANWWTSSPNGFAPWFRTVVGYDEGVIRNAGAPLQGFSVRCIED